MSALLHFQANLPSKPYCSSDLSRLIIRPAATARQYAYIQPNDPFNCRWIVFDIDRGVESFYAFEDAVATPNLIVQNPANSNCHYLYLLKTPVWTKDTGKAAPQSYLKAVKNAMTARLGADPCYTGLICKNPLSDDWRVSELYVGVYDLGDLAKFVNLQQDALTAVRNQAFWQFEDVAVGGRNDHLFTLLRHFAYERIKKYRDLSAILGDGKAFDQWAQAISREAQTINQAFPSGLPGSEIKSTAKSVAGWVWAHHQPGEQTQRGKMGFGETRHTNPDKPMLTDEERKQRQQRAAQLTNKHRKETTELQIRQAIERLQASGQKVTKAAVAKMTGLDRINLGRNYAHFF